MKATARRLLTLSSRGMIALILIAIVIVGTIGYFTTMWIPTVTFAVMVLVFRLSVSHHLRQVAASVQTRGLIPTAKELDREVRLARGEEPAQEDEQEEAVVLLLDQADSWKGDGPRHQASSDQPRPTLRIVSNGDTKKDDNGDE